MILVDANLLLFAADSTSPFHPKAARWLEDALNAESAVGIPWQSIGAFLRIATHPRASATPLSAKDAWAQVDSWLACDVVWIPQPTARHPEVLAGLLSRYRVTGNLVPDAMLAAVALEHGLTVCSADTDFALFSEVRWENPVAPSQ